MTEGADPQAVFTVTLTYQGGARDFSIQFRSGSFSGPVIQTFTVTQTALNCSPSDFAISPEFASVHSDEIFAGGPLEGEIQVTAPAGCAWIATTNVSWIEVFNTVGAGPGRVSYRVGQNTGVWRSGTIKIGGKDFRVFQAPIDCLLAWISGFTPSSSLKDSGELTVERSFRDTVLARTPRGRRYTELYYQFSSEAVQAVMLNPMLILRSREMIELYKPTLESMIKGEQVVLTEGDLDEIASFLNGIASKGSRSFQLAVKDFCSELRDPQLHAEFGIHLTKGPKREPPASIQLLGVRQMAASRLLLGSSATAAYGLTGRRRKWLRRQARPLLVIGLVLSAVTTGFVMPAAGVTLVAYSPAQLTLAAPQLAQSTYLGGNGVNEGNSIAVNAAGNTYVTGFTDSINFPLANAAQADFGGGQQDGFVAKFNPAGALVYSTYLGGAGIDGGAAIAVDGAGQTIVTGFTGSLNFPAAAAVQPTLSGSYDGFVARLTASGAALDYSTYLGGSGIDSAFGVAADSGAIYVMGVSDSTNFPTANPFQQTYGGGPADLFVARIKAGPVITAAAIKGKHLDVTGSGFDQGAVILLDGRQQKTLFTSGTSLRGKKVGKKIAVGQSITLQVRNSDGSLSQVFSYTR